MNYPIYHCLWYNNQAKEAANKYCSAFTNSEITFENDLVSNFVLNGQKFMGLNGGPMFKPNPSISFFAVCETIEEIEHTWKTLLEGGIVLMPLGNYGWSEKYGWLQDKYGVNWQIIYGKIQDYGQKFIPALLFTKELAGKAEESINHYTSIFDNSSVITIQRYTSNDNDQEGLIKHARFRLNNQSFIVLESTLMHDFSFSEGISFVVECDTQQEIDYFWEKLTEGGSESQCGWLKDKYGASWQIIPSILSELMSNPQKSQRVVDAFMRMKKFDIETLKNV